MIYMLYIIDANNLAGKLKMLGQEHFDKALIAKIEKYFVGRKNQIIMVFDGQDTMGDKKTVNKYLTVFYSPKDDYYLSADDKIVEIVDRLATRTKDQITIITDDIDLRKRIEKIQEETDLQIFLEKATAWADKILKTDQKDFDNDESRGLSEAEVNKINQGLLKEWK